MFRFGIIGAGGIAGRFCDAMQLVDGAAVTAVSSKSTERAKAFAESNHIDAYYGDYAQMLTQQPLDAVYIATTHNFHFENILLCLQHNMPVICEKPLVLTKKQAEEVFKIAREKNLFVMEAMWSHFLPCVRKAKQWIEEGRIGEVVSASYTFAFAPEESHRVFNPAIGGGAMYDIGVYCVEGLLNFINKPLQKVTPVVTRHKNGVDLTDHVLLQFDNCVGTVTCSIETNMPTDCAIYGTKGAIFLPDAINAQHCRMKLFDGTVETFEAAHENGFQFEIMEAIDCIRKGLIESPTIPHAETVLCAEIFDTCLETKNE